MMQVALEQLQAMCSSAAGKERCALYLPHINDLAGAHGIDTPQRMAMFICQVLHESAEFKYVRELGNHEYLDKYDTGRLAERLGNTPEDDDDGQRYRGRGLIQVTGAANYRECGKALGLPLTEHPELLEQPRWAVASACWYWHANNLHVLSDVSSVKDITRKVNGGYNGLAEREEYFQRAARVLGLHPTNPKEEHS